MKQVQIKIIRNAKNTHKQGGNQKKFQHRLLQAAEAENQPKGNSINQQQEQTCKSSFISPE